MRNSFKKIVLSVVGIISFFIIIIALWANVIFPMGVKKGWILVDENNKTSWAPSKKEQAEKERLAKEKEEKKAKKEEERKNSPSKFEGITIGQEEKLKEIFKKEADKKLTAEGKEYKDYKMSKTDNNYVIYGTKVTADRGVNINNLFTVGIYWDGSSEEYKVHTNSYAATAQLSTDQESKLYEFAKQAVKTKLFAPETADFPFIDRSTIKYSFDNVKDKEAIFYQVYNYVKYKNAFNVPLKSNFVVELEVNWNTGKYIVKNIVLE